MSYLLNNRHGPWTPKLAGWWLFCTYYVRSFAEGNRLIQVLAYFHPFWSKKAYIKCEKSRTYTAKSLRSTKINTTMPSRTKSVEINQIVTNSEIHLHQCLCESRGFKIGRRSHRRCSIKKIQISLKWQENTCVGVSFLITLQALQLY